VEYSHERLWRPGEPSPLRGRKRALGTRAPITIPQDQNLRWSLDFVMDTLVIGRRFRILTVVDDFTRNAWVWSWTPRSPLCA
jgi:transposase InsO family protein